MVVGHRDGLVGRDGEVDVLRSAVDALADAAASLPVQLVGEPGIGKSRLLAELSDEAQRRGHLVLSGRAAEFEMQLPFGVFVAALDDYLASLPSDALADLNPAACSELATVFPGRESWRTDVRTAVQNERYRTYRAVRTLLETLARARPVVLLLDDVHWTDPASAELLGHLLAHPPRGPFLLAVAFRPAQVPPRLGAALAAAARTGMSRRIELAPLTRAAVDELVSGTIDGVARDDLFHECGGNPFYLEQLLRPRSMAAGRESFTVEHVPDAVVAALEEELAALPEGVRSVLEAAAVTGDPFDADLAAAVAEIDERDVWPALDVLVERDVVRTTAVPSRFGSAIPSSAEPSTTRRSRADA